MSRLSKSCTNQMESPFHTSDTTPSLLPCNRRRKRDYRSFGERINELPDDILVNVLSHMTIKEAARTSVLSSRWKYLWKWFNGCLNLHNPLTWADLNAPFELSLGSEPLEVERHKFVKWVNQVLRSLQGQTVKELSICFDLDSNSKSDVENWIKFAAEKRVQRLELNFTQVGIYSRSTAQYTFPSLHHSNTSFTSLSSLSLENVGITGEFLEHLLSYCPSLEVLSVTRAMCLTSLKVSGPSLKLRYLKLDVLPCLEDLELQAPSLTTFEYGKSIKSVSFENVPNLVEVSFALDVFGSLVNEICWHSSLLMQLHTLKLDLRRLLPPEQVPYDVPELYNLKHLEMRIRLLDDDCLLPCAALLKASPMLYKFTLELYEVNPSSGSVRTVKDHPYLSSVSTLSVRVVELVGFVGHTTDAEFVPYLIERAHLLEKIIIDPCKPRFRGKPPLIFWFKESEYYQSARKRAIELEARFPLWEFVIL